MKNIIPLLLFAFSTTFSPGPNNFMMMSSAMYFGIKKSLPHYFGICLGFPAMVLLMSLGLGTIFTNYVWIKEVLKVIGSLYILYLAWQILTAHHDAKSIHSLLPFRFWQAVAFQWINPKAWLVAISTISIFTVVNNYFINALIISGIYFLMCIPCVGAWLLFGTILQKILWKNSHRVWFNIVMAFGLVASVVVMLFD